MQTFLSPFHQTLCETRGKITELIESLENEARDKRVEFASQYWREKIDYVVNQISLVTESDAQGEAQKYSIQWMTYVHQEIVMWASIGHTVNQTDLDIMSDHRSFNSIQKQFCKEFLQAAGLWKEAE